MKTFVLAGDPALIAKALNAIYKNNPKLKVVMATASHHIMEAPQTAILQGVKQGSYMPVQVYYLTYTGIDLLVDENGKPLEGGY